MYKSKVKSKSKKGIHETSQLDNRLPLEYIFARLASALLVLTSFSLAERKPFGRKYVRGVNGYQATVHNVYVPLNLS